MLDYGHVCNLLELNGYTQSKVKSKDVVAYELGQSCVLFSIESGEMEMFLGNKVLICDNGIIARCPFPTSEEHFKVYLKELEYIGSYDCYRDYYESLDGKQRTKPYNSLLKYIKKEC